MRAVHICGVDNRLPDLLSRWALSDQYKQKFFDATKELILAENEVTVDHFRFSHCW